MDLSLNLLNFFLCLEVLAGLCNITKFVTLKRKRRKERKIWLINTILWTAPKGKENYNAACDEQWENPTFFYIWDSLNLSNINLWYQKLPFPKVFNVLKMPFSFYFYTLLPPLKFSNYFIISEMFIMKFLLQVGKDMESVFCVHIYNLIRVTYIYVYMGRERERRLWEIRYTLLLWWKHEVDVCIILIGLMHILTHYIKRKVSCTSVMALSSLTMFQRRNYISI